jgi:hypothetical protein
MKPAPSLLCLIASLLTAAPALAVNVVQDSQIAITPVMRQFPVTALGTASAPADFTVSNLTGSALNISGVALSGVNPTEFEITTNGCSGTLAASGSCTVSVSFKPATQGTKSALLQVSSSSTDTPTLSAYLTNSAAPSAEAQQRMPPILASVTIADPMTTGTSYDISWSLEGYDSTYQSYAVLFDCTGIADGSCGNSYTDLTRFAESPLLAPSATASGNWSYGGVTSKKFTYHWNYTPSTRSGGAEFAPAPGSDIVVRFYQKSDIDIERNNSSVSLLIPGNQGTTYYDTAGRRILVKIQKAP